tara:strand:+ start:93 stop:410 length:318 start_codon:yes stop_codon:yes gene_type:complete
MKSEKILSDSLQLYRLYLDNTVTKEYSSSEFEAKFKLEFKDLYDNYKSIYNISINEKYDYNRLKYMLNLSDKINNNEISEHDASVQVGQVLVDQIVKPQLDKIKK